MPMTAAQIVQHCCAISKVPGYVVQGGQYLNLVLQDLYMKRNLKANLITGTLNIPANSFGPFPLPANYARTYDMFYYVSGAPYFIEQSTLRQYDQEDLISGIASYPYERATDLSGVPNGNPALLWLYPQSSNQLSVTHRYYCAQPDIVNPQNSNTIPWFSDAEYLIARVSANLMRITDDDRMAQFNAEADRILEPYLMMAADDEQEVPKEVRLDWHRFRIGGSARPTKIDPY